MPDEKLETHIKTLEQTVLQAKRLESAKVLREQASVLQQKGDLAGAINKYRESLKLVPDERIVEQIKKLEQILNTAQKNNPPDNPASPFNLAGVWEGKDKDGETITVDFKADHTVTMLVNGKAMTITGSVVKWEIVDVAKNYLDLVMSAGGKDIRRPMWLEVKGKNIVIGEGKTDGVRPVTFTDVKDAIELSRK